jgi:hypothetical protein
VTLFESQVAKEPRLLTAVKVFLVAFVAFHAVIALLSGYRAIWQLRSLDVTATEQTLRPHSQVKADLVTSGRVIVNLRLELVQGDHSEPLGAQQVWKNNFASYDPRPHPASLSVELTPELLSRFRPGPARVRATAVGGSQWVGLLQAPSMVREIEVEIPPAPASPPSPVF